MKIERSILVKATPDSIIEYLTGPQYVQDLNEVQTGGIIAVTEKSSAPQQILRYEATTRLPGFLKKYESKAPPTVFWEEHLTWNLANNLASFQIVADAPAHWQERYTTTGRVSATAAGSGSTKLVHELEYKIKVFGLGTIIEKALSSEIEAIFDARNQRIQAHFA